MKLTKLINNQISVNNKSGVGFDSQMNENELHDCHLNKSEVFESASDSSVNEIEEKNNQVNDRFKKVEGYHAVPPPYTGNYMPSRPDLSFAGLDDFVYKTNVSETISSVPRNESTASKSSKDSLEQPKDVRPSAPIIKEWETDSDDDCVIRSSFEQNKPSYAKLNFVKSVENTRKSIIEQHTYRQAENLRKSQSLRVDKRNWNGIMTQKLWDGFEFNRKSLFYVGYMVKGKLDQNGTKLPEGEITKQIDSVHNPKRNFVPTAVVTKSEPVPVNAAKRSSLRAATSIITDRHVNTAALKQKVNNVTTVGPEVVVSTAEGKRENVVKSSACWIWRPTGKVIDHISKDSGSYMPKRFDYVDPQGRLKHMTGNKSYLTDYQDIDGGFVAFAGSPKGGKITGKGKIRTGKLDFEDVYFVKELKFSWVFFLATKDETSGILKTFITGIENQINHKVKIIRCDNGTEFKNNDINQFCRMKGIKREFSVARTPQQNGVVERKNRTLIEATRTILADSYYLLHFRLKQLVTKPHNKTPYELLLGRPSSISFMRPFGCPVTILNTLDPLGKFDEEKGLDDRGSGPDWLFDIDLLTNSMNYEPVIAGNQTIKNAGIKDNVDAVPTNNNIMLTLLYIVHRAQRMQWQIDAKLTTTTENTHESQTYSHNQTLQGSPKDQIIGDINSGLLQTRRNTQDFRRTSYEPKKVIQALTDPSWIEVMQEELLQFKLQKVWTLWTDFLKPKEAIGTKWVFQVTSKTSQLHAVKRIFRYLKGQPKLGLWYPKDSPFDLEAFYDSDLCLSSLA
ncbi:ribonuclease H-like domain-containing protein [Tanacetum coccineum]